MFGKIQKIENRIVYVENLKHESMTNLIGFHVIFEDKKKIVGEILFVDVNQFKIILIGEIDNNCLTSGIIRYPLNSSECRLVTRNELEMIIGSQDLQQNSCIQIGKSAVYDGLSITANINDLFSNHFAILGNAGSGKSCGFARIMQNLFTEIKQNPVNSHFIIFDTYGEYKSALTGINSHQGINVNFLTTSTKEFVGNMIKIPPYLLEVDDLAVLLNVEDRSLIPVLENTLRYAYIFNSNDELSNKYKNSIIAKTIVDLLSNGKTAQQNRDQIIAFLTDYNTEQINLNTLIVEPGYQRTLRQCLNIDNQGKFLAVGQVVELLKKYIIIDIDKINIKLTKYTIDDLYKALEFALLNEGSLNNSVVYEKVSQLKTRLYSILNSEQKIYFEVDEFYSKEDFVKSLFKASNGENAQILDINFDYVDDRFAKTIVKIYSKMFYDYVVSLENRGSYPINIVVEEAHRYIQNDNDLNIIGYNIFDRIAKEGRKYGILLGIITQRISELSPTALSQCSNFIIFKMYYPDDINIVASIASNVTLDIIENVKALKPGAALVFGGAFKLPLISFFDIPNPMPTSTNVDLIKVWYN